jgi:hypothetical protein
MPQLDFWSYFHQVLWLGIVLVSLYFFLTGWYLPRIYKILRYRRRYLMEISSTKAPTAGAGLTQDLSLFVTKTPILHKKANKTVIEFIENKLPVAFELMKVELEKKIQLVESKGLLQNSWLHSQVIPFKTEVENHIQKISILEQEEKLVVEQLKSIQIKK